MTKAQLEQQIFTWLNNQEIRPLLTIQRNVMNIAFHHLVRWHPQISVDGLDTYSLDYTEKIRNWDISMRAIAAFREKIDQQDCQLNKASLNKLFREVTHPEHNVSVSLKKQQLIEMESPSLENVRACLNTDYGVVILSKLEMSVLNGSRKMEYQLDGNTCFGKGLSTSGSYTERLASIGASLSGQNKEDIIEMFTI